MGSRSITIGQYIPGNTFMHQLDPRAKLLALFMFIAAIFIVKAWEAFIPFVLLVIALYLAAHVPFRYFLRGIRPIIYIIVLTSVLHIFFTGGGEVLFRYGVITVEAAGVELGLFTIIRLMLLVFFTMLVTLTTTPLSLTEGLERFLWPLKYLKVPVAEIAMILNIALRFIPTLMEESERIVKAQMARGADFGQGNILRRIKFLVPVIVPLFVSAFRRADELAVAMESRCYRAGAKRTRMNELKFGKQDYGTVAISVLVVTGAVLSRFIPGG